MSFQDAELFLGIFGEEKHNFKKFDLLGLWEKKRFDQRDQNRPSSTTKKSKMNSIVARVCQWCIWMMMMMMLLWPQNDTKRKKKKKMNEGKSEPRKKRGKNRIYRMSM